MNLNLQYRKAIEHDIDFLFDLRMKTMTEYYAQSNLPTAKEFVLQRILYEFDKAHIIILNNEPIGLLKIDKNLDKIHILQLQINPNLQGKGIGKSILKSIVDEAKANQKNVILSVLKVNKAQHLYLRLGFEIIDENEHSYFMEFSK